MTETREQTLHRAFATIPAEERMRIASLPADQRVDAILGALAPFDRLEVLMAMTGPSASEQHGRALTEAGAFASAVAYPSSILATPPVRTESFLRKTLHHPLIYCLGGLLVIMGSLDRGPAAATVAGLVTAALIWFCTSLLP